MRKVNQVLSVKRLLALVLPVSFLLCCNPRASEDDSSLPHSDFLYTKDPVRSEADPDAPDTLLSTSNSPFPLDTLILTAFQRFASATIQRALNDPHLSYAMANDTVSGIFDEYFRSPELQQMIRYDFSVPPPNSRFSFDLSAYSYTSVPAACAMLGKAATIEYASDFGLAKHPSFLFRIDNHLFWLAVPHSMSGRTSNALRRELAKHLRDYTLDSLETHVQFAGASTFEMPVQGRWRILFPTPIDAADTTFKFPLDNVLLEIRDSSLQINGVGYKLDKVYEKRLPDVQAYFAYYGMSPPEGRTPSSLLSHFKGPITEYSVYCENLSGREQYRIGSPLKPSHVQAFVKLPDGQVGFILEDALYLLERR